MEATSTKSKHSLLMVCLFYAILSVLMAYGAHVLAAMQEQGLLMD
jgi:hypothetical protein